MPISDAHIHVGQFYSIYTTPQDVVDFMSSVGVEHYAVSSTTTCEGNYAKVVEELTELQTLTGPKMSAVLWLLPQMFFDGGIDWMRNCGINWSCLKIHPQLHTTFWTTEEAQLILVELAKDMQLPILIHTGEYDGCYPEQYESIIDNNPSIMFVLAHGRPIKQTIALIKKYENVWTDTAFMPIEGIIKLCNEGLSNRVLWGTDYPIVKHYYPECDMKAYYHDFLLDLQHSINQSDFNFITSRNFEKIFI